MAEQGQRKRPLVRSVEMIGAGTLHVLNEIGSAQLLLIDAIGWVLKALSNQRIRMGRVAIITQVVRIGVRSIAINALVAGCVGFILGLQMAPPLDDLGQVELVPNIIAVAVLRELGPLMAAIVMTGYAGAAIAAEIGTMVVGEEIEALEAHALNPVRFLVVPRIIAVVVSLTMLAVISDVVAIFCGFLMGATVLDIPPVTYWENTFRQVDNIDFLTGVAKGGVFGMLIAVIACNNGLRVTGGAAGVGNATTLTVVRSIVAIIFADLIFTAIFYVTGLG
ncbi:MAG: MlaE family ABC transporter permease [Planctomycetota bacterium]|jgi:phospholipid/cholesterol/gamma-HCH transport system permease protein